MCNLHPPYVGTESPPRFIACASRPGRATRSSTSGATIPAIIRGYIASAWCGVQTYLAATSLMVTFLKFFSVFSAGLSGSSFLGLSPLGYL